jgi:hypothetical protein
MRAAEGACRGKEMVGHVNGTNFAFNHRWHHLDRFFFNITEKDLSDFAFVPSCKFAAFDFILCT